VLKICTGSGNKSNFLRSFLFTFDLSGYAPSVPSPSKNNLVLRILLLVKSHCQNRMLLTVSKIGEIIGTLASLRTS
jgi:hypothetical protein